MNPTDTVSYDYDLQDASGATCTAHAWAKVPAPLAPDEKARVKARIKELLKAQNAVLVAHYYVDGDLKTWPWRQAAACRTRWRRPALAVTMPPRP